MVKGGDCCRSTAIIQLRLQQFKVLMIIRKYDYALCCESKRLLFLEQIKSSVCWIHFNF